MVELVLWSDNADISMNDLSQTNIIFTVEYESICDIKRYGALKKFERVVDTSSLMYSTGYIDTIETEFAINKMINIIEPKLSKIVNIIDKY